MASGWTFAEGTVFHCLKHRPSQGGRAGGGGGARAHGRAGEEGDEGEYEEGEMLHDGKPGAKSSYKIQEGTELYKQWLRDVRQEQDLGRLAPQVGDRVVYLPHAHSCFIRLVQKWQQPKPDEKEPDAAGGPTVGGAGAAAAPDEGQVEQPKAAEEEEEAAGQGAEEEATEGGESGSKPTAAEAETGGAPPATETGASAAAASSAVEQDKEQEGEDTSVHGPWEFFPRAWSAVLCVVTKVEYGLPESEAVLQACDSITATVTLHVVGVPDDDTPRHNKRKEAAAAAEGPDSPALVVGGSRIPRRFREVTEREEGLWMGFTATIRECEAADFLVLEGTYLTSLRQDWSVGRRVKSPYFDTQSKEVRGGWGSHHSLPRGC